MSERRRGLRQAFVPIAVLWFLLFLRFFYSLTPPNNPTHSRADFWEEAPWILLDTIDPPEHAAAVPSGWLYLPQRFDLFGVAGVILAGAWGLGHLVLRLIGPPRPSAGPERTVFAFAVGLAGLSLLTLACGLAGLLQRWPLAIVIVALVCGETALRVRARWTGASGRRWQSASGGDHPGQTRLDGDASRSPVSLKGLCLAATAPFLLAMLLGAVLPSTDFDVKEYHLQGPKEFYQNGRIGFLPHNVYTSFPFQTEMLSLLAMVLRGDWWRGGLAGKAVLMCFAPLTALALYAAGRRWFSPASGWLAAAVYLTTPWVFRISTIAYAEGGLTFYLFVSLLAVMRAFESKRPRPEQRRSEVRAAEGGGSEGRGRAGGSEALASGRDVERQTRGPNARGFRFRLDDECRWLLLAGLLAGGAMACKYTGAVQVVAPLFAAVAAAPFLLLGGGTDDRQRPVPQPGESQLPLDSRRPRNVAMRWTTTFLLGAAVTAGPWLLKNLLETGNPVYPLMYTLFGGRDWGPSLNEKWRAAHAPPNYGDLPERVLEVTAGSDWLSPLLFGLAPLSLLLLLEPSRATRRMSIGGIAVSPDHTPRTTGRSTLVCWLWVYVLWLFATWWGLTHRVDRFWVPMLPVVALLAGVGAAAINRRSWRYLAGMGSAAAVIFNLAMVASGASGNNGFLTDLKAESERVIPPGIAWLNRDLPADAKVLMVGEAQVFDARFPLVYNTVFDYSIFEQWCGRRGAEASLADRPLRDPAEVRSKLQREGVTHLFVNWQEVLRYRTTYGFTEFVLPARFSALQRMQVIRPAGRLAVAIDENLWKRVQQGETLWAPAVLIDEQGSELLVYGVRPNLPRREHKEIARWGPSLLKEVEGKTLLVTAALYEVAEASQSAGN